MNGKLLKKIGQKGEGPGDFNEPISIDIDAKGNLLVADYSNGRIQILSNDKNIKTVNPGNVTFQKVRVDKNGRIILQGNATSNGSPRLLAYDYKNKQKGTIGIVQIPDNKDIIITYRIMLDYCVDKEGCIYAGNSYGEPSIEKYSKEGSLIMKINYKLATEPDKVTILNGSVDGEKNPGLRGIDVDADGNIYVLAQKRKILDDEGKYFSRWSFSVKNGISESTLIPPKERKAKHDIFHLIVFDKNGNLKSSKSLEYLASGMRVIGDNLFVFDSSADQVIFQYKIQN